MNPNDPQSTLPPTTQLRQPPNTPTRSSNLPQVPQAAGASVPSFRQPQGAASPPSRLVDGPRQPPSPERVLSALLAIRDSILLRAQGQNAIREELPFSDVEDPFLPSPPDADYDGMVMVQSPLGPISSPPSSPPSTLSLPPPSFQLPSPPSKPLECKRSWNDRFLPSITFR